MDKTNQRNNINDLVNKKISDLLSDKTKSDEFFIKVGIYDKNGNLTEMYSK